MEVSVVAEKQPEGHMTSAAAFVEGGIQEACDDACSICLEEFGDSNPAAMTTCRHEFHMQCILEWCQRSSQCPMCWQQISMKDPDSQELLEIVEQERRVRDAASRNVALFHHPAFGEFELQHVCSDMLMFEIDVQFSSLLDVPFSNADYFICCTQFPVVTNNSDIEERIIQHLAAAAAMRRAHHIGRRESHRNRTYANGRPHYFVYSTPSGAHPPAPISTSRGDNEPVATTVENASETYNAVGDESPVQGGCFLPFQHPSSSSAVGSNVTTSNHQDTFSNTRNSALSSVQDGAGPSDFQSFSDSLRSKLSSLSMRYKESISKSTRCWKERLFSRNNSLPPTVSDGRGELNAEIASEPFMEDSTRGEGASVTNLLDGSSIERSIQDNAEVQGANPSSENDSSVPRTGTSP